ncbi:MAG: RNA methyltransferase [Oscillospiraceae bacterium]|nr:RNA methyltransferase [Oscillospiraceae bacterium]
MGNVIEISDIHAPELGAYARLTEAQLRNRRHPEQGIFIAESAKVIGHGLDAGYVPISLLMERRQIEGQGRAIIDRCGDIPVYTADRELLERLTGYQLTRGILCAMKRPQMKPLHEVIWNGQRVAILDGLVDPTNVGAAFRSAAALGMDAVLVTPTCCDPLNRRAVRVSMGTVFQVPWTVIGASASDWPEQGMKLLHEMGFKTAAMALCENSVSIDDPKLMGEERLAVIMGTEGDGLDSKTIDLCDYTVMIPMANGVDSLNVAAASAVAFWQLGRH